MHLKGGTTLSSPVKDKKIDITGGNSTFVCPTDGRFPHETYCEKFYYCSGGNPTPQVKSCSIDSDHLFSTEDLDCNSANLVHCHDRIRPEGVSPTARPPPTTTTTTTTSTPPTPPPIDFECRKNGAFAHPVYCELYYDCWEGKATLMACPNDYLFDDNKADEWETGGCAPPEDVQCWPRIPPTLEFRCPVGGPDGMMYPDPLNCAAYYTCTHGRAILRLCSSYLLFHRFKQICDYPAAVDCSDRQLLEFSKVY